MAGEADLFEAFKGGTEPSGTAAAPAPAGSSDSDLAASFSEGSKQLEPTLASTAIAPFTGFNKALISLGVPADLIHAALKKTVYEPLGYEAPEPFGGTESIKRGLAAVGVEPEAERFKPRDRLEQVLQAGGQGVGEAATLAMAAPAVTSKLAAQMPRTAEAINTLFATRAPAGASKTAAVAPMAELAIPAFTGGAGAEIATEMVPEKWKPLAGMGGGLAGGTIGAIGVAGSKAIPAMARGISDYFAPMTEAGVKRTAAETLEAGVQNPLKAIDIIENEPRELVSGSKPTLFELTGEGGQLQRRAETLAPEKFNQRRGEQAAARLEELGTISPQTEAAELPNFLRGEFDKLDKMSDGAVKWAEAKAREEVEKLGGVQNPEQYGNLVRKFLEDAKTAMNQVRKSLYDAIDPDGTVNIVVSPIKNAADNIVGEMSQYSTPLSAEANRLLAQAKSLPDVMPFKDLKELDTAITTAMSAERRAKGQTPEWGRLQQLKNATQDAIANSVEHQAAFEQRAVSAGAKAEEDTLAARISAWVKEFQGGKEPAPKALEPNMTAEEAARLKAAKEKHAEYAQTFKQGPVGNVLKTSGYSGQYMTPDATVVGKFFPGGNGGFEAASAFRKAVGDDTKAVNVMQDYIVWSLRNAAEKADGTLDPKKFDAWRQRHDSALRAFPELEGRFNDALKSSQLIDELAVAKRDAIKNFQEGVVKKLMGLDESADVSNTIGSLFGRGDAVKTMKQLADATAGSTDARDALKRSVADYINKKFISTTEAGASGTNVINSASFQKFVRDNRDALKTIFNEKELGSMQAIADDLHRANRSVTGTALPGRSTTAQDLLPDLAKQREGGLGFFGKVALGGGEGFSIAGLKGLLAGVSTAAANNVLNNMRRAGLENVQQLVTEALLNPDVAAELLKSVKPREGAGIEKTFAAAIRRLPAMGYSGTIEGEPESGPMEITVRPKRKEQHFAGGRVGRATGGRTMHTDVDTEADALVRAAENTKKALGRETEVLLNHDDNTIANALEVANKTI